MFFSCILVDIGSGRHCQPDFVSELRDGKHLIGMGHMDIFSKEGELKTEIAGLEQDIAADQEALATATAWAWQMNQIKLSLTSC